MKGKVPRAGASRRLDRLMIHELAGGTVQRPDNCPIEAEIVGEDEPPRRVGLDHVRVRRVVAARRERAARTGRRARGADAASGRTRGEVAHDLGRRAEQSVRADRNHGHAAAAIVGDEDVRAPWIHAQMSRTGAAGRHRVQDAQVARRSGDGVGGDGSSRAAVEVRDCVGRIQEPVVGTERKP